MYTRSLCRHGFAERLIRCGCGIQQACKHGRITRDPYRHHLTIVPADCNVRLGEHIRRKTRGLATRARAALGIISPAPRPEREVLSLDWDRPGRVTPAQRMRKTCPAASQEAWPEAQSLAMKDSSVGVSLPTLCLSLVLS